MNVTIRTAASSASRYNLIDLVDKAKVMRLLNQFAALHQISIILLKGDARETRPAVLAASVRGAHASDAQFTTRQIQRGEALLASINRSDWSEGAQPWSRANDGTAFKYIPVEVGGQILATLLVGFVQIVDELPSQTQPAKSGPTELAKAAHNKAAESEQTQLTASVKLTPGRFKQIVDHLRTVIDLIINEASHKLQAEENKRARTQSDRRYRAYFDDCPDAILVTDDRGGIMEVNPLAAQLTGYSNYDLLGLSLYDLACEDDLERIVTLLEQIRNVQKMNIEFQLTRADESRTFVELSAAVLSEHEYLVFLKDISLRKQIEIEIQNRVDYFHRVFHNNPSPMLLIDPKTWQVTTFNTRFQDVTGLSPAQITGMALRDCDLFAPDEWQRCIDLIESVGFVKEAALRIRGRQNELRETLLSAEVFKLLGQSHCVATFFDVTERNLAERRLALSEQRLRAITDNISGLVAQYFFYPDKPPQFCYVSRGSVALVGLEPEQIIADPTLFTQLILADDFRNINRIQLEAYLTQQSWEAEFRIQIPGTTAPRWLHASASTVRMEKGKVAWIAYFQDVTEKKFAIEHLRRSEQKMAFYLQHNPLPYIELNANLEVVEWNTAAQNLFGYTPQEAIGRSLTELVVPVDMASRANAIFDLLRKQVGGEREELVNQTRHQHRLLCEWYSTAITNAQGALAGIAILVRDVSEQRLLEGALREHRDHLEQMIEEQVWEIKAGKHAAELSNQAKSDFLNAMSTTLRDPLHSILAFSELYLDHPAGLAEEKKTHYMEHIRESALHLIPVLEDLADLTRIDRGEVQFNFARHDLGDLVATTIASFRSSSPDYSAVVFEVSPAAFPREGRCDAERKRQVLVNVFQNAVKFSPAPACIKIRYYQDTLNRLTANGRVQENALTVEIRDHGIGIPEDQVASVFDASAAHQRNRHGFSGAGLGLPLCREFIEQHHGKIGAFNAPGGGVAITFSLPLNA